MQRIYHSFDKWEDFKAGFYSPVSVKDKNNLILKVIELFTDQNLTEIYMNKVINEWRYSCEHNLTNNSLNKIAYIGQAACCLYAKIPFYITMNAWNKIDIINRNNADKIAAITIKKWEQNHKLKSTLKNGKVKGIKTEYQMKLPMN